MSAATGPIPPAARASYPLRPGNAVQPWIGGVPAFERICRAVESARHSVFVTVAFLERDVEMPGGRGGFFDVLERAAARGLDVRVLFWRKHAPDAHVPGTQRFDGTPADHAFLRARGSRFRARWDRLARGYCQHQKSWLVDAGEASEVAFVGGINPIRDAMSVPGFAPAATPPGFHDVYLELCGPAATDVHHNFVQRWNGASERDAADGCWPDARAAGPLAPPAFVSPVRGDVPAQIARTVRAGAYDDRSAAPGAKPYDLARGEQSVLEQYVSAIAAAERTIYLENQTLASPIVAEELRRALVRGVRVIALVPGAPPRAFIEARRDPRAAAFFAQLADLGRHERFTLAALCASRGGGRYDEIYVHAKVAVVDDTWATVGSTNIAVVSFRHETELNASFWQPEAARSLREALFASALGRSLAGEEEEAAFLRYAETARRNLDRRATWEPTEGFVYALDPAQYGA